MHIRKNSGSHNRHQNAKQYATRRVIAILAGIILIAGIVIGGILLYRAENRLWDPISEKQLESVLEGNEPLPDEVETVVDSAASIVGKVHYFWGGKSKSVGWDENWGKLKEVVSEGSKTTGTKRPFGLDCSGLVTWCFIQTGYTWEEAVELVGNGTMNQWERSVEIAWEELRPGDLVFQHEPGDPEGNHVGICVGFDEAGEAVFIHCAAGENHVIATHADGVFRYARRPMIFVDSE